jgi:hypothetical protein
VSLSWPGFCLLAQRIASYLADPARLLPRMIAVAELWPDGSNQWDTGPCLKTSYINACRAVGKGICDE